MTECIAGHTQRTNNEQNTKVHKYTYTYTMVSLQKLSNRAYCSWTDTRL